jgi:hypothetical protein
MPCGSSDGTYNGVYPSEPIFFSNSSAQHLGLTTIRNMLSWYKTLPGDLQSAVYGFTLLNEPGLGVVKGHRFPGIPTNKPIIDWLTQAVSVYKSMMGPSPPLLYMNLHESAFPGGNAFNEMGQAMTTMGLSGIPWAVFDVHHYFSWGGAHGAGIPAANCSTELTRCDGTLSSHCYSTMYV